MERTGSIDIVVRELQKMGIQEKDIAWMLNLPVRVIRDIRVGILPPALTERRALAHYLTFRRMAWKIMEAKEKIPGR